MTAWLLLPIGLILSAIIGLALAGFALDEYQTTKFKMWMVSLVSIEIVLVVVYCFLAMWSWHHA